MNNWLKGRVYTWVVQLPVRSQPRMKQEYKNDCDPDEPPLFLLIRSQLETVPMDKHLFNVMQTLKFLTDFFLFVHN